MGIVTGETSKPLIDNRNEQFLFSHNLSDGRKNIMGNFEIIMIFLKRMFSIIFTGMATDTDGGVFCLQGEIPNAVGFSIGHLSVANKAHIFVDYVFITVELPSMGRKLLILFFLVAFIAKIDAFLVIKRFVLYRPGVYPCRF